LNKQELIGKKVPVLDKGYVQLIDVMGSDSDICDAARVSYGKGTKTVSNDETLLRYMMRHGHTSPFEMAELKFKIHIPMDAWRQWIRHRTANVNEISTRYSEACDDMAETNPNEWRLQSKSNRQGSQGYLTEWPGDIDYAVEHMGFDTPGEYLSYQEFRLHDSIKNVYQARLRLGVAREQARKDLPLSQYTTAIWKIDLHNLLGFTRKRLSAQLEIAQYAKAIYESFVRPLFPMTYSAFEDYVLHGVTLSRMEVNAIRSMLECVCMSFPIQDEGVKAIQGFCDSLVVGEYSHTSYYNRRELNELLEKLQRILPKSITLKSDGGTSK
jgi:thymidylate synthase (FAD)